MGRGRAKAKQTKVARQLKYSSGGTDLDRLRAELTGSEASVDGSHAADEVAVNDEDDDDPYARYADDGGDNAGGQA